MHPAGEVGPTSDPEVACHARSPMALGLAPARSRAALSPEASQYSRLRAPRKFPAAEPLGSVLARISGVALTPTGNAVRKPRFVNLNAATVATQTCWCGNSECSTITGDVPRRMP
jgi:hypothetical protein